MQLFSRRAFLRHFVVAASLAVLAMFFAVGCRGRAARVQYATGGGGAGAVQIVNASNESIFYVYMSPASDSSWGPDLLGANTLPVGQALTLSDIGEGYWDLRVVDRSGHSKEWRNFLVAAGQVYTIHVDSVNWSAR